MDAEFYMKLPNKTDCLHCINTKCEIIAQGGGGGVIPAQKL